MKKVSIILVILISLLAGFEFSWSLYSFVPNNTVKYWAHRVDDHEKIEQVNRSELEGVEIDVFFKLNKLIVKHDLLSMNSYLLSEHIANIGKDVKNVWLDIKNLNSQNAHSIRTAISHLDKTKKYYIESKNIFELSQMKSNHFTRIAWVSSRSSRLLLYFASLKTRTLIILGQIKILSFDYLSYQSRMVKFLYRGLTHYLFTVNDKNYVPDKNVKVILTDDY